MRPRPEWVAAFRSEFLKEAKRLAGAQAKGIRRAAMAPLVRRTEKRIAAAFTVQGRGFLARLARMRERFPTAEAARLSAQLGPAFVPLRESLEEAEWKPLWDAAAAEGDKLLEDALVAAVKAALTAGAQFVLARAPAKRLAEGPAGLGGIGWKLDNPAAEAWLAEHGAKLVKKIDEGTRNELLQIILEGTRNGRSYDDIAGEIQRRFEQFGDRRAALIAITEIGNAYEVGEYEAALELQRAGLTVVKWWSTVGDDQVSDLCQANEDEGELPLEQEHASGDQCPLGHPACRCTEMYDVRLD